MAAIQEPPNDFILSIARTGRNLITSYTKFIIYRKAADRRLENLYATLSIITSKLEELGSTINLYEKEFHIKDEVTNPVCEKAKVILEKLLVLINEGISPGVWKSDGTIGGGSVAVEVDPWFLITIALGGREKAKEFWKRLDETRDELLALCDVIKYMSLRDLSRK
jgi:hypothetical protein